MAKKGKKQKNGTVDKSFMKVGNKTSRRKVEAKPKKPVTINDVDYESITQASKETGISRTSISRFLRGGDLINRITQKKRNKAAKNKRRRERKKLKRLEAKMAA